MGDAPDTPAAIVADLAQADPIARNDETDRLTCALCGGTREVYPGEVVVHRPRCPWRRARELAARGGRDG